MPETAPRTATARVGRRRPRRQLRRDIQGLRAVAVLLVFAEHLTGYPRGGFIGVDVFFVISGFLITGLLLREHDTTGHISFVGFYRRRLRRIIPAAVLVLVVTDLASGALFTHARAASIWVDSVWAALFAANYRFAIVGTDYFGATAAVSPLQHYWSLSVEEQFYFVWPWLMLLIFGLAARSGAARFGRAAIGATMAAVVAASFAWALVETAAEPTWAYFSSLDRVWELGAGALLAIAADRFQAIPSTGRILMAWLGLAIIAVGALFISGDQGFPAPWAVVPVLGAGLVIAGGIGGEPRRLGVLTNVGSRFVGDISYSLYLWHFPLIVLLAAVFPRDDVYFYVAVVAGAFGLSTATYFAVEEPFRRHGLAAFKLTRWSNRHRRMVLGRAWREINHFALKVGLPLLLGATVMVGCYAVAPPDVPRTFVSIAERREVAEQPTTPETEAQGAVLDALQAMSWPKDLDPSITRASSDRAAEFDPTSDCMYPALEDLTACTFGSGPRYALIVGDSVGIAWLPAVREALGADWTVRDLSYGACSFLYADVRLGDPTSTDRCNTDRDEITAVINELDPDMVILTGQEVAIQGFADGATGQEAIDEWVDARSAAVKAIEAEGREIVLLTPPPVGKNPDECATALSSPGDCIADLSEAWGDYLEAETRVADLTSARVVDVSEWFCSTSGHCPAFIGTTPVRVDEVHISNTMAGDVVELVRRALLTPDVVARENRVP